MINPTRNERAILRSLYYADRELSTNQIANKVDLSPVTTKKILLHLEKFKLVKKNIINKKRIFMRFGDKIVSERIILWRLNVK